MGRATSTGSRYGECLPAALPIDRHLPEVLAALGREGALVLAAEPGAGKTTRVPPALLAAIEGEVLVTEPRRLAARMAAARVADERGEAVGESVGYAVRFETVAGPSTRLCFVTEGVLLRRLLRDPDLGGVGAVMIDEVHERHRETDLLLALLERLRRTTRPDLRLVIASATLDVDRWAAWLGTSAVVRAPGRLHPVRVVHAATTDQRPLEKRVVSAVRDALSATPLGDVLVFLPGASEIHKAREALGRLAAERGLAVLPLHGDLPFEEQRRALEPTVHRKVVLSTNVAESSVTLEGVTAVVDSGLVRRAHHSPWTGLPVTRVEPVSRASAEQRAGRAGRLGPGLVLRLYTEGELAARPAFDEPELVRSDLAEPWLLTAGMGIPLGELRFPDPPPDRALEAARTTLSALGAVDHEGALTTTGRRLLELPLPPRLGRLVVAGEDLEVRGDAALAAAVLSERAIRDDHRAFSREARVESGDSDLTASMELLEEAHHLGFAPHRLRDLHVDPARARAAWQIYVRIRRARDHRPWDGGAPELEERARRLTRALLLAFPDRVARRRRSEGPELVLASGATAELSEASAVRRAPFLLALDVEDRALFARGQARVRLAHAVPVELLLDAADTRFTDDLVWSEERARVESVSRAALGAVLLEESRVPAAPSPEAAAVLLEAIQRRGMLPGAETLDRVLSRLCFLGATFPELSLPADGESLRRRALEAAVRGRTRLDEVHASALEECLFAALPPGTRARLDTEAPERVLLAHGRSVQVQYAGDRPPWIESRLQDFFGQATTPRIASGRVFLTVHLLAPNQRAVQVTSDLAGFWSRHYPALRRELMRRYPRHAWPEDGATATPPTPRPRGSTRAG